MRRFFLLTALFLAGGAFVFAGSGCAKTYPGDPEAALTLLSSQVVAAGLSVTPITARTTENGGAAGFYVSLRTQPVSNVTVGPITISNGEASVFSGQVLTFTTTNWSTGQLVILVGNDDFIVDGNVSYNITVGPIASQDALYASIPPVVLTNINDDNDKYIYVTTNVTPGVQFTSVATADTICNSNANKPSLAGATYAAMLVDGGAGCVGATRCASSTPNTGLGQAIGLKWVFHVTGLPSYVRKDGVRVFVPNVVNLFNFGAGVAPACGSFQLDNGWDASAATVWTGLNCDWTTDTANTCNNWAGAGTGRYAVGTAKDTTSVFSAIDVGCATARPIVCVQQ
ncbi:MAG: DUF1554 domain-containing protein [Spirochaetia bacterium]|nr:DUF1554 domain-containing protein [Spirochaetia bacterium]